MTAAFGDPEKDVANTVADGQSIGPTDLSSDEKTVLGDIRSAIGTDQVTRRKLEGIPAWKIQEELK